MADGNSADEIRINKRAMLLGAILLAIAAGAYFLSFSKAAGNSPPDEGSSGPAAQDIYIRALRGGTYDNLSISVKSGIPVRLHFTADPDAGCGRQLVIYGLGVGAVSRNGAEDVVEFTPQSAGAYEYSCGMRMWGPGKLVVA